MMVTVRPTLMPRGIVGEQQIEEGVRRCLQALETADRAQPVDVGAKTERLREKIETLRGQVRRMGAMREQLKAAPDE